MPSIVLPEPIVQSDPKDHLVSSGARAPSNSFPHPNECVDSDHSLEKIQEFGVDASPMPRRPQIEPSIMIGPFFKHLLYELVPPIVQLFVIFPIETIMFRRSFPEVWNLLINKMHVPRLLSNQSTPLKVISIVSNVVFFMLYGVSPSQTFIMPSFAPTRLFLLPAFLFDRYFAIALRLSSPSIEDSMSWIELALLWSMFLLRCVVRSCHHLLENCATHRVSVIGNTLIAKNAKEV
jgi:hypothetical protein